MILLKLRREREVNLIWSEFGSGITKEELLALYEYATHEKFSPLLIIGMMETADKRFSKGLIEVFDIHRKIYIFIIHFHHNQVFLMRNYKLSALIQYIYTISENFFFFDFILF